MQELINIDIDVLNELKHTNYIEYLNIKKQYHNNKLKNKIQLNKEIINNLVNRHGYRKSYKFIVI